MKIEAIKEKIESFVVNNEVKLSDVIEELLKLYAQQFRSIGEAKSSIFEYIEVFYNRLRRHSSIGYVALAEFERMTALAAS